MEAFESLKIGSITCLTQILANLLLQFSTESLNIPVETKHFITEDRIKNALLITIVSRRGKRKKKTAKELVAQLIKITLLYYAAFATLGIGHYCIIPESNFNNAWRCALKTLHKKRIFSWSILTYIFFDLLPERLR